MDKSRISVAIMIYGDSNSKRDALTEEKYKELATAFLSQGFDVESVLYNDEAADELIPRLLKLDVVLVWVNPIEQGKDRKKLDALLVEIAGKGCFVSTHPEVILKMGTKDVLFTTKDMDWGGDTKMYSSFEDFTERFPGSLQSSGIRVLKQYRGNGGDGVYKIINGSPVKDVRIIHAKSGDQEKILTWNEFNKAFKPFFSNGGSLIDQEWNQNTINGMVRCYSAGTKVAGFGYQEINALYELNDPQTETYFPPSKRHYYTENCGLFKDLKDMMEKTWIPQLQKELFIDNDRMPVIWDADFFINDLNGPTAVGKYSLCEINVSSVSPSHRVLSGLLWRR